MQNTERLVETAREGAKESVSEQLEVLKAFAAIDCGTGNIAGNDAVIEVMEGIFSRMDIDVSYAKAPGVGRHVVARISPGNPNGKIVINAHLDTVFLPGDTAAHPFRIEGDFAYGLGVADCKGGVTVSLFSLKLLQEAGMLPDKEICCIYNCDEETGSASSIPVLRRFAKGAEIAFVYEATRGNNGIITSRRSRADAVFEILGRPAHAASYSEGRSALVEMARLIMELNAMHNSAEDVYINIGEVVSRAPINQVPDEVSFMASCRVRSVEEAELYFKKYESLRSEKTAGGCSVKVTRRPFSPPMARTEANLRAYEFARRAGGLLGIELAEIAALGAGDASPLSEMGIPTVDGLGPYIYDGHSYDERVLVPSIEERTALSAVMIGLLAQ